MAKLPSKIRSRDLARDANFWQGGVDLDLFRSNEFYNYLSQAWVYSRIILVSDDPMGSGKGIEETINQIIELIDPELEHSE